MKYPREVRISENVTAVIGLAGGRVEIEVNPGPFLPNVHFTIEPDEIPIVRETLQEAEAFLKTLKKP